MVQQGIDRDRIIVKFNGEKDPVCLKETCQELNRRVELRL
jgi:outer membrane protein OmpA-like peptidoglycan-associated protein